MSGSSTVPAVVAYEPSTNYPTWKYEQVTLTDRPLKEHELRVRMVATGICHSDVYVACIPGAYGGAFPKVLGHEGAGYVEAVGSAVTTAKVGDPVLLSYSYCNSCDLCSLNEHAYCQEWMRLNSAMEPSVFTNNSKEATSGKFFGQSSFSSVSIVDEVSVVNAITLIQSRDELKLLAPLGCGFMTGSGAVINALAPKSHDILLVAGVGAVGAGAIMAAKIAGVSAVIAIDKVPARLDLAKELGATHVLNTANGFSTFVEDVRGLVSNKRITVAIDTTGVLAIVNKLMDSIGRHGRVVCIGIPPMDQSYNFPVPDFFTNGKSLESNYLGNALPKDFVPKMVQWYREGKFPIDKLVGYFPANQVAEALHGMESGKVVKPVLVWDEE